MGTQKVNDTRKNAVHKGNSNTALVSVIFFTARIGGIIQTAGKTREGV
jgi:hypothetical protein